jgi:hypothetical protein
MKPSTFSKMEGFINKTQKNLFIPYNFYYTIHQEH